MVTALIFAGGTGYRMNSRTKPKQFLELHGKPVLIHTIEHFERHHEVDAIAVVCLKSWIGALRLELERFFIKKVKWIVAGGSTGQESIYNGLNAIIADVESPAKTIVLLHDGVRPLINEQLITDNIASVREYGNAVTVAAEGETVTVVDDNGIIIDIPDRSKMRIAKAPQSFYLSDIYAAHKKARADSLTGFVDSATMMRYYGHKLYTIRCGSENVKITTATDYYIFRALYEAQENSQILGV